MFKRLLTTVLLTAFSGSLLAAERILVADFENSDLTGWEEREFSGATQYDWQTQDGRMALQADSRRAASGLVKKITIDLSQTPYLNWSWWIDAPLPDLDERSKPGDDYVARLYVVISGGLFFWKTRALNYVWSGNQASGSAWPNAYTANARMLAVQSGSQNSGRWVSEKRNVREDLRRQFGKDFTQIDAIAIMTDTDNSGQSARAYYGNIFFSRN